MAKWRLERTVGQFNRTSGMNFWLKRDERIEQNLGHTGMHAGMAICTISQADSCPEVKQVVTYIYKCSWSFA